MVSRGIRISDCICVIFVFVWCLYLYWCICICVCNCEKYETWWAEVVALAKCQENSKYLYFWLYLCLCLFYDCICIYVSICILVCICDCEKCEAWWAEVVALAVPRKLKIGNLKIWFGKAFVPPLKINFSNLKLFDNYDKFWSKNYKILSFCICICICIWCATVQCHDGH